MAEEQRQRPRWYVTTTIPYVNGSPHIGMALEYALTDTLARYHRRVGEDVFFLTGTDENSLKNVRSAEREGIPVEELVARNSENFRALCAALEITYDDFIRTSADPRHLPGVRKLWAAVAANGDIYKRSYRGLYCVGCEQFYTEDELVEGLCPEHLTPPEEVEEENYFFRLSRYQRQLEDLIVSGQLRIVPETRRNEVLGLIRQGLADFSVSRSRERAHGWGIPVPGDPSQVMYVWFDALGNYITALDYAHDGALYERYWVENPNRIHMLGKGVIRFHAVYWPAMLLSAGVPLPSEVAVHGYITVGGRKIGKSLGNTVDPVALVAEYGAEAVRFFLLREISPFTDSDFTLERFVTACNTQLADQLGNLLNRTVNMLGRYCDGAVPAPGTYGPGELALIRLADELRTRVDVAMRAFETQRALESIWELVTAANRYVNDAAPWTLAKQRAAGDAPAGERLVTALYTLAETLRLTAAYLEPFLPETAAAIAQQLGVSLDASIPWSEATCWGGLRAGTHVQPGGVLFAKREPPVEASE